MCASPAIIKEYLQMSVSIRIPAMTIFDTYCTCTALLIIPVVVLGGNIPTKALSKSPRSKFMALRPELGGVSSCQHSRWAMLFAAEIAVMLKTVVWLATPLRMASTVVIETNLIAMYRRRSIRIVRKENGKYVNMRVLMRRA
jgi:hypothetical protein